MVGLPQLRTAGWLITGTDADPVRHLFLRLTETVDGSGVWTVELQECRGRRGQAGTAMRSYPNEVDARTAVQLICQLSCYLAPLPTADGQRREAGRWRLRTYEPVVSAQLATH
jgi:hypothetical protein